MNWNKALQVPSNGTSLWKAAAPLAKGKIDWPRITAGKTARRIWLSFASLPDTPSWQSHWKVDEWWPRTLGLYSWRAIVISEAQFRPLVLWLLPASSVAWRNKEQFRVSTIIFLTSAVPWLFKEVSQMPNAHSAQRGSRQLNQCRGAKEDLIILTTPRLGPSTVLNGTTRERLLDCLPDHWVSHGLWAVFHKSLSLWGHVQISKSKCRFS